MGICAGLALATGSLASCTYTLPQENGSGGAGGDGLGGAGGNGSTCSTGLTDCDGICVDTTSDAAHCGACNAACAAEFKCTDSQCKPANPICTPGTAESCYDGPPGTENIGLCHSGTHECLKDGSGFSPCIGEVLPTKEDCSVPADEDCDGSAPFEGTICLTNEGLVVRYVLNEAASGQTPTMALDSAANPLDLTIDYAAASNMNYTEAATGRGLNWLAAGTTGTASAPINGTKVYDAFEGKTQGTIEVVVALQAVVGESSRIFSIGQGAESGRFTLASNATDRVQFRWNDNEVPGNWPFSFGASGRAVLHVVVDTTDAVDANRVRLYVNGAIVTENKRLAPFKNTTITVGPDRALYLGNREGGVRSFAGSLYYAALYNRPLSTSEIAYHAVYLLLEDD